MPELESYRETLANDVVLDGVVEYYWYVGCTPTAVSIVMGYWDRHGFDNLIQGDTSFYSEDIKRAIASQEHFDSYYYPEEEKVGSGEILPDKSELGGTHQDNSIADFLQTSRSVLGSGRGSTKTTRTGTGVHGYTSYKGYEGFETTFKRWGDFTWNDIITEIDNGRPVLFSVDSDGNGNNDHAIVVIGYNQDTQEFAFHDGWKTDYIRWEPFRPMIDGDAWGINGATFVRPPETQTSNNLKSISLVNDGSGSAASYKAELLSNGTLDLNLLDSNSGLGRTKSIAMATADGHKFYRLYDDGSGSAALYEVLAYGDGKFKTRNLNPETGLSRTNTIGFATADGNIFYQLENDGEGSAALYELVLQENGTFQSTLLNSNSGLSRSKTLELATTNGSTFYRPYNDGEGSAALYEAILEGDGTFSLNLLNSDSGLSFDTIAYATWQSQISAIDFSKTTPSFLPIDQINANVIPPDEENNVFEGTTGNDLLEGDNNSNNLTGLAGNDTLNGYGGDDNLVGGAGNDILFGKSGSDRLNGTDSENRGSKEYDVLQGGTSRDIFVLGDSDGAYYIADGYRDYAKINQGFVLGEDTVELHGSQDDYRIEDNKLFVNNDELVAIFKNVGNVDLNSDSFVFV